MHVVRRNPAHSGKGISNRGGGESANEPVSITQRTVAGPLRGTPAGGAGQPGAAVPIWFAVLMASTCLASVNGEHRAIRWDCVSGRALYTNRGGDAERIEPLGVSLKEGQTLAVYWQPGETAYTVEVYRQNERCA